MVADVIEGGHIQPRYSGRRRQQVLAGPALPACALVKPNQLHRHFLPLAQGENVHKGCQGLRVVSTGSAGDDERGVLVPVGRARGKSGQVQHIEHIGICHLIAQREADDVKVGDGVPTLQSIEGQPLPAHLLLHIPPGGEHTLTPHPGQLIHQPIEDPHPQIGHANLIGIGKAHGDPRIHLFEVLHHCIVLSTGIPGRFLHPGEDRFHRPVHSKPPLARFITCYNGKSLFYPLSVGMASTNSRIYCISPHEWRKSSMTSQK